MTLPAPLVPSEVDLRDFRYMLIDVRWVLDSESFWRLSDTEFRTAFLLIGASWHQKPAASIPDDDRYNANLIGFPLRKFRAAKEAALAEWVTCSDGRLYHPVIAPRALAAWAIKLRQLARIIRRVEMESGVWQARRMEVFRRDNFTCRYCGARNKKLECDHVHPLSRGGNSEIENLATACKDCNRSKSAKTVQEWLQ